MRIRPLDYCLVLCQIIGYMVILYFELGVAALIGCVVFFITIPLQVCIARQTAKYQKTVMVGLHNAGGLTEPVFVLLQSAMMNVCKSVYSALVSNKNHLQPSAVGHIMDPHV